MKQIYITLILLLSLKINALEIISVTRDYYYPNIFYYKHRTIGESKTNIFTYRDIYEHKFQPEIFIIKLNDKKFKTSKKLKVIFEYKSSKSDKLDKVEKTIKLDKKKKKIKFIFSTDFHKDNGRIEIWTIKIYNKNELIASKTSPGNKWR